MTGRASNDRPPHRPPGGEHGRASRGAGQEVRGIMSRFATAVEGLSDADGKRGTPAETRPVGCVAHHVAGGHARISGLLQMFAKNQPLPKLTRDLVNENNAKHLAAHPNPDKAETLEMFRGAWV